MRRILLVDDEPRILGTLRRVVSGLCEALTADCAEDALTLLATHDVAALITDVNMGPGMDGIELVERLRAAGHTFPILVCTGNPDNERRIHALQGKHAAIHQLDKPWAPDDIRSFVQRLG